MGEGMITDHKDDERQLQVDRSTSDSKIQRKSFLKTKTALKIWYVYMPYFTYMHA